jgi:hypothetical protein
VLASVVGSVGDWIYNAFRWTWHDPDGYNFISGPLADITLIGGGIALLRHHNCHVKGCWRLARHPVAGTDYIVCRTHHPHDSPTAEQVLAEHDAAVHGNLATARAEAAVQREAPAQPPGST